MGTRQKRGELVGIRMGMVETKKEDGQKEDGLRRTGTSLGLLKKDCRNYGCDFKIHY